MRSRVVASAGVRHLKVEDGPLELSLVFTDDAEQRALNRAWRNQDRPTNVLSFPNMDDGTMVAAGLPRLLGDVVLARETVPRGALEQGKTVADHTGHLLVPGILHLLGYDPEQDDPGEAVAAVGRSLHSGLVI